MVISSMLTFLMCGISLAFGSATLFRRDMTAEGLTAAALALTCFATVEILAHLNTIKTILETQQ